MDNNLQNNTRGGNQELIAFLTQKFDVIDKRFEGIDEKIDSFEEQLSVFKEQYVNDYKDLVELFSAKFDAFNKKLDQKADRSDIDAVLTRVTQLSNKVDDYHAEQIGLKRQVEKHEKWHNQTAAKIGLKLQPE